MSFQQSAFQHNAFQVGVSGGAAADAVVRAPTYQQEKRRPQVIATVAVNLLVSTLAAIDLPVTPNAHASAPQRVQQVYADTSAGMAQVLRETLEPLPPGNAEQLGPVRVLRTLADTSASTPKTLYADVVQPVLRAPTYQQGKTRPAVVALQYPNLVVNVAAVVDDPIIPTATVHQSQARQRLPVISCPPSLKAGPLGNSYAIRLEWTDIAGEDGYRVKWGWTSGNYAVTQDVAANVTSFDIDGLPLYQNVYWIVCSMLGGVEQSCTTEIGLTVGRGHTPTTGHIVIEGNVPTVTAVPEPIRSRVWAYVAPVQRLAVLADTSLSTPRTLYDDVAPPEPPVVVDQQAPAGSAKKQRGRPPKRFVVEWNSRIYHVEGEREALALLAQLRAQAEKHLPQQAKTLARRAVKQDSEPPIDPPTIAVSGDSTLGAQRAAEQAQAAMAALYEREAERAYIAALEWHLARLRDEHEALTLLVLDDD